MANLDESNNKNASLNLIAEYGTDTDSDDTESRSNTGNEDSDNLEHSEMVLKNNLINACAHGPLSRPSALEDMEVTRHMIIDSAESGIVEYEVTEYRDADSESEMETTSSSDSTESDVASVKDAEEVSSGDEDLGTSNSKAEPPKVKGELGLEDLPPIEDLAISLPSQETTKIGSIASIVDRLVIVRALPETPAVDLDSVLFLENGAKSLGKVFDVFGPVTEPHYCVRFNSLEHVKERGVEVGMDVFIAPRSHHTNYVFLTELIKLKGSDASWMNDVEPPPSQVEYSDDEEERRANRARKEQRQNKTENQSQESDGEPSRKPNKPERRNQQQNQNQNQRPSESSSRFGSGPSRGRNPFSFGSRRNNPNVFPRFMRMWPNADMRNPPPNSDPGGFNGFAPPGFPMPYHPSTPPFNPITPPFNPTTPPFNPTTPPPLMGNTFQLGNTLPRMHRPILAMNMPPPFRPNMPVFGSNFCNNQAPWANNLPPPPPGT